MNQESWHAVIPQYTQFDSEIRQFNQIPEVDFLDIQPRLKNALSTFCTPNGFNRLLVVNSVDNALYRNAILTAVSNYEAIDSIHVTHSMSMNALLGSYTCDSKGDIVTTSKGLLETAHGGYLIIPATMLLANPVCWNALKSVILGHSFNPVNSNPKFIASCEPQIESSAKILIVGDRHQLGDFEYLEPELYTGLALYTEVENELALSSETIGQYLGFISWLCQSYNLPSLSYDAVYRLLVAGARYTEDQGYMPIEMLWCLSLLSEASQLSGGKAITDCDIESALEAKYQRESYLPERALADITNGQVIIETQGECVGQVNGLTVIDVPGHPMSYGEPARISCVIHFGDGDISDVERKAELGGNLHAKGMMIMQAFVSTALDLDEPLPYSASVVFEQSYSEVDGDSATLAELCSFVSALSEYPIDQQIAVTGAVDQFGRVQAVGGLNEKIEGFYHVCRHQGFTGKQGVILPTSNLKHLALHKDVVESIKSNEFHIWSVSTVDEAIPLIMGKPFRGEDESSVISKIAQRIESFERHEHPPGIVERIKNWFS